MLAWVPEEYTNIGFGFPRVAVVVESNPLALDLMPVEADSIGIAHEPTQVAQGSEMAGILQGQAVADNTDFGLPVSRAGCKAGMVSPRKWKAVRKD